MFVDIRSIPESHFHFVDGLPPDYKGPILPGSKIMSGTGESGTLILQEITEEFFNIQLSIFHFFRKFKLTFASNNAFLQIPYALKNKISFNAKQIRNIQLKQNQHAVLHIPGIQIEAQFEKEKEYHLFDIHYSEAPVKELSLYYSKLQSFFTSIEQGGPFIFTKPSKTPERAKDIVQQILHSPYNENLQRYFFEMVAKECLFEILVHDLSSPSEIQSISEDQTKKILDLEEMLSKNLDTFYPLSDLAKRAQMNQHKLQDGFKQLFGRTVFDYHRNARLEEARRLIVEEKMQIKEVFRLVGYKKITAFIEQFKAKFGYTPGSIVKKR
jgi:AraC-like DNA-binding protein